MEPFENKIVALLYVNKVRKLEKYQMSFMNLDFSEMMNNELFEFAAYGFIRGYNMEKSKKHYLLIHLTEEPK